jgi:transposase
MAIKTVAQQNLQPVHSIRKELGDKRPALVNQRRGLLSERGSVINQGITQMRQQLPWRADDAGNGLTAVSRALFAEHYEKLKAPDDEIKAQTPRINRLCNASKLSQRFLDVPGVGPLTAMLGAADRDGRGKGYKSSRDYAARAGVAPKQHSSADKQL